MCSSTITEWRQVGNNVSLLDLRAAYLQIRVHPSLWKYQIFKYKGRNYTLTRLCLGLNVAPKIMVSILRHVLALDPLAAC
ncbi:hypothetical protein GJ496_002485 [Pomphorhynchus laevis]|nr:hypothetical protein GJ496_002485 [Pomphorhynchus laevis]